jgi:Flp pilus assembly protein TadG
MCSFIYKRYHHLLSGLRGFFDERSGVVVVLVALAMPVLAGAMGLAAETSFWYVHKRGMQNAADAAAIAAATGANASSNYSAQALAVATQLGFTNGSGNVKVTASPPITAVCPATSNSANSYKVTISDDVPLFLSRVIGYAGDATVNKNGMTAITASSTAVSCGAYWRCPAPSQRTS